MKRSFAVYGSVTPPAPSASSKKTVAADRITKDGRNSNPQLPEVIELRREASRLSNAILDNIRSGKCNNADEFNAAYMELCGLLELDDAQIKRFKGFVCYHHLVPTSEGGDSSVGNLRPFIYSSHFLLHIVLATYWPNKHNLVHAVNMMAITMAGHKDVLTSFPEEVLAAMDAAVVKSHAANSRRQTMLASTGDHVFHCMATRLLTCHDAQSVSVSISRR